MSKATEALGYARGLLKAVENDPSQQNTIELLRAVLNAMDEQQANIRKLDEQFTELDEYVESIDDDLAELEDMVDEMDDASLGEGFMFGDEDEEFDDDEFDRPLHLVHDRKKCKCGHDHGDDHECHCHEEGHECHCHDDEDCDCEDDEELDLDGFDNLFLGVMCPECSRMFCVTDADFDDPEALYHCPYCEKDVHISPIDPANVPVAKRVK